MKSFDTTKRERFLEEGAYSLFVKGSTVHREELCALIRDELPTIPEDDPAYMQWSAGVAGHSVELLIGHYSSGGEVRGLIPLFVESLADISNMALPHPKYRTEPFYLDELDTYAYAMWLLSLCKLLRLDPLLPRVAALFDVAREESRGKDALFEALLDKLGQPSVPAKGMLKNLKAHPLLLQAIEAEPKKKSLYVAEFLKKWYPAMKATYWYDRHRRVPQNFFGYWAFEAGLVTVLWDIDDSGYRDLPFYPKDLVDFARRHPEVDMAALGSPQAGVATMDSGSAKGVRDICILN
jgi:hypothetical protein